MTYLYRILVLALFSIALSSPAFAGGQIGFKLSKCDKNTRLGTDAMAVGHVDGDTVHVQLGSETYSVRVLGIDAQETHFMGKSQGEWGEKAAAVMAEMLPQGTPVTLEYGVDACDMHGRLLAHIFKGGLHVNAEMVKQGLAVNYCVAPDFRYCDEFSQYTAAAIENHLGMFSVKDFELPYDFRRRIENNPQRSYVGDIQTKEVRTPGHQNDVPIANRVFFYTKELVKDPYHLVDQAPLPQ